MKFRDSFSTLKKKVKHRLTGRKPKPDKTGERVDSTGSFPGAEPHVVAGGSHGQEGDGANADGGQVSFSVQLPQLDEPGSALARGSVNNRERRGGDIDEGEVEQIDVEVAEGSGPAERKDIGEKVEQVYLSPSSIPHDGKSYST